MQTHLSLLWSKMTFWNADVSGRLSFADPDATGDQTQTLGEKVSEADRPELILSLAFWVSDPATHFSVAHLFPCTLGRRAIPILEGHS